jgi:hypothetical protein
MYAKDQILVREQYLGGVGGVQGPQPVLDARKQRGVLDILAQYVDEVAVRRVVRDIVLLSWNPPEGERIGENKDAGRGKDTRKCGPPDIPKLLDLIDAELARGSPRLITC